MKIKELAAELKLTDDAVLEKARAMGIDVSSTSDDMEDIDATAVKNTILRSGTHTETKVVRAKAKKSENDKKEDGPKVTVKAANIKLPEVRKTAKAASRAASKTASAKPPVGKPIVSREVEGRPKPPKGKPVVSKTMLEDRIAKENAETEAPLKESADTRTQPEQGTAAEQKSAAADTPENRGTDVKKDEKKTKEQQKSEPPRRRSGLKVIKRAEDVRR